MNRIGSQQNQNNFLIRARPNIRYIYWLTSSVVNASFFVRVDIFKDFVSVSCKVVTQPIK